MIETQKGHSVKGKKKPKSLTLHERVQKSFRIATQKRKPKNLTAVKKDQKPWKDTKQLPWKIRTILFITTRKRREKEKRERG